MVDLDARIVERNFAAEPRPEILDSVLVWNPRGASEPLAIDLPRYFARVFGEDWDR